MFSKPNQPTAPYLSADITETSEVETIVGPSVKVEGDFVSQGNVLIQGIVAGTVKTERHLEVQEGAKIAANVRAASAKISGEIRGNVKVKEVLELTPSARVIGDVDAKILIVAAGAVLHGRCTMAGAEIVEATILKQPSKGRILNTARRRPTEDVETEYTVGEEAA